MRLIEIGPELAQVPDGQVLRLIRGLQQPTEALKPLVVAVVHTTARMVARNGAPRPWRGYLGVTPEHGAVGTCGFKSAPADGEVELAYFTFPLFEGRGLGKQMAARLVEIARASQAVSTLVALTRPETSKSTSVLQALGFSNTGEAHDPSDGLVWRWEKAIG